MDSLPDGFITVAEAIELIKNHTDDEPIVNLKFLVVNRDYIEKAHNFTIKLAKKKDGKLVDNGTVYVRIAKDADKYTLREEIKQAYKRNTGLELNLDERPTREITTVVDPQSNAKGMPMLDTSNDSLSSKYMPNRNTRIN